MISQTISVELLRKCRICGLEAYSETELEKFHKHKQALFGYENLCKLCWNAMRSKGGKHEFSMKRGNERNNPKQIKFLGKSILLRENPRINVCSECGRCYPEELKRQTSIHHEFYDKSHVLKNTWELCVSCHAKLHGLGISIGIGRGNPKEAEKS